METSAFKSVGVPFCFVLQVLQGPSITSNKELAHVSCLMNLTYYKLRIWEKYQKKQPLINNNMQHKQLIDYLKRYGNISEQEEQNIRKAFSEQTAKKKDILIRKNSVCNKLFFVNKGLLRAYYEDDFGNETTRRIAWEHGFITNMDDFLKTETENNETIECIENAEFLEVLKSDWDVLVSNSENLGKIHQIILAKYVKINIRRVEHLTALTPEKKLIYFNENFPALKNRITDVVLATFLGMSRITLIRTREKYRKNAKK
ncbi:MAG: Crp/Fnr family transcriptional regulator [Flavobacteriaceae bacterium]|nr:Crp/Fnr family transcriptional regulator [Flavobacteriaceae bacterium]